jgi:hypothetical protein
MMGNETMFPGANDNASGVSLLLNLVKHFSASKPAYTVVFIAFAGRGNRTCWVEIFYRTDPLFPLAKIKFLLNFDLAGTGDDGIQVGQWQNLSKEVRFDDEIK